MVTFFIDYSNNNIFKKLIRKFHRRISHIDELREKTLEELLNLYREKPLERGTPLVKVICEKILEKYRKEHQKDEVKEELMEIILMFLKERRECAEEYRVLVEFKDKKVIKEIIKRWEFINKIDPNSNEKINIIEALGEIGGDETKNFFLQILKNEKNIFFRERALEKLKEIIKKEKGFIPDEIKDYIYETEKRIKKWTIKVEKLILIVFLFRILFPLIYLFFLLPLFLKFFPETFILKRNFYNLLIFFVGSNIFVYVILLNIQYFISERNKKIFLRNWEIILISLGLIVISIFKEMKF